ncbi:hypothetical protein [Kingella potus]|uniref:hypothetical protein n=1 Tax=Kingella potus TaxID=265175 RepID=UPI001FD15AB4|nr:hypothetical protein [Kingella potus]UOP00954.1 hypothetical protein LVJ84_00610 [Kingella potus]
MQAAADICKPRAPLRGTPYLTSCLKRQRPSENPKSVFSDGLLFPVPSRVGCIAQRQGTRSCRFPFCKLPPASANRVRRCAAHPTYSRW